MPRWKQFSRRLFLKGSATAGVAAVAVSTGVGLLLQACGIQSNSGKKDMGGNDMSANPPDMSQPQDLAMGPPDMSAPKDGPGPDLDTSDLKMYGWLHPPRQPGGSRFSRWLARRGARVKIDLG